VTPKTKTKKTSKSRAQRLWKLYRLTPEDFDKMMAAQGVRCAISGKRPINVRLNIDHRHADGMIRGLLTMTMNKGLGYFNDDPALLRAAADYLDNPPAIAALGRKVYGLIGQAKVKRIMKYGPKG
jgi:hypothetical protein